MKKVLLSWVLVFVGLTGYQLQAQSLDEGLKQLRLENYDGAQKNFEGMVAKEPVNGINYYYLGETQFLKDDFAGAKATFQKGVVAAPKDGNNYAGLALVAMQENNTAEAKTQADKAISLGKKDASVYTHTAEAFISAKNKDFAKAEELLNTAQTIKSGDPENYIAFGDMFYQKGKLGDAIVNYEFATDKDPKNFYAFYKVGQIYVMTKNYDEAAKYLEKSVAAEPNFGPAHRELAEIYMNKKEFQKAKDHFAVYAATAENQTEVKERYAKILYSARDYTNAIKEATAYLQIDPNNMVMNRLIAYSNYELGNYPESAIAMQKVFDIAKADKILPTDYEYYANMLTKEGKDSMAMIYTEKAIDVDSTKVDKYSELGDAYYKMKKFDLAANAYQKAINKKAKPSINDYLGMGTSYYYLKEYGKADSAFATAVQMNPNALVVYLWRGKINARIDADYSLGMAIPYYQKVMDMAGGDTIKYRSELIEGNRYMGKYYARKDIDYSQGSALPYYKMVTELAALDSVKYKNELMEAYKYLGSYYSVKQDLENYKLYWIKVGEIDPTDKDYLQVLETLK